MNTFLAYAKHKQELEDIIMMILQEIEMSEDGSNNIDLTFELDDNLSESDIDYIKKEVMRRA